MNFSKADLQVCFVLGYVNIGVSLNYSMTPNYENTLFHAGYGGPVGTARSRKKWLSWAAAQ